MIGVYLKLALAFLASLWLLRLTVRAAPRLYTVRFISGYYTFQFAALLAYLLIAPDARVWNAYYPGLVLRDYIDRGIFAYFLFQIGALSACWLGYFLFSAARRKPRLTDLIKSRPKSLGFALGLSALIFLTYPLLSYRPGIGFFSSMLFNFLNFIPFAAGVFFFQNNKVRWIWLLSLSVLFVLGILTGGRGTAMTAAALYALGFYQALESPKAKRLALVAGVAIAIPLMSFLAFVGIFRHLVGRVDFDKINLERAVRVYRKYEKLKDSKVLNLNTNDARLNGWGRFVNYVNFTELAIVPERRPHLGVEDLLAVDFRYSFDIAFFSGTTTDDRIRHKFGNFRLNDYGYLVTKSSSVEYSILTEAYIRFGYPGIFIFAFFVSFLALGLEYLVFLLSRNFKTLQVFAVIMLCQQALLGYAYNLFVILRNMVLAAAIAATVVFVFVLLHQMIRHRPREHASTSDL